MHYISHHHIKSMDTTRFSWNHLWRECISTKNKKRFKSSKNNFTSRQAHHEIDHCWTLTISLHRSISWIKWFKPVSASAKACSTSSEHFSIWFCWKNELKVSTFQNILSGDKYFYLNFRNHRFNGHFGRRHLLNALALVDRNGGHFNTTWWEKWKWHI